MGEGKKNPQQNKEATVSQKLLISSPVRESNIIEGVSLDVHSKLRKNMLFFNLVKDLTS